MEVRPRSRMAHDQELGKRDDDHLWTQRREAHPPPRSLSLPTRWRRSRLLTGIAIIFVIYVLHIYVPTTPASLEATSAYRSSSPSPGRAHERYDAVRAKEPQGPPPTDAFTSPDETSKHYYNGVTRFYKLASSLLSTSMRTAGGGLKHNTNVLFAASSLKSLANLILMACEMSNHENDIHIAVFGRSTLSLEELKQLNGIAENSCVATWHDARGDYAEYSSEARVEAAVKGAMKHIHEHMHPQVIITDDSAREEPFFVRAMHAEAKDFGTPLIEIPSGKYEDLLWAMSLRARSLAHWHEPTIDIVIQAPTHSCGSLIRLLKSLANADYRGMKVPRLIIELPSKVEPSLQSYLEEFQWPPGKGRRSEPTLLTLRHRIVSTRVSSEQAALRFVESFYPNQPTNHHVLLLSPQAELSPQYLHYLHYAVLHYRYSAPTWPEELMGFSLETPGSFLNGTNGFKQPTLADMGQNDEDVPAPFMYQAPSSTATLVFGDKWVAFHDFLTNRIQAFHSGKAKRTRKLVSESQPAWMEHLLELISARNWFIMHPAKSMVTAHKELAQVPEEYLRPSKHGSEQQPPVPVEEPFLLSDEAPALTVQPESDPSRDLMPLHKTLPFDGELQSVSQLPYVGIDGELASFSEFVELQDRYTRFFRKAIGGCRGAEVTRPRIVDFASPSTSDLFCLSGQTIHFADEQNLNEEDLDEGGEDEVSLTSLNQSRGKGRDGEGFVVTKTPAKALSPRGANEVDGPADVP